jgi:hypothetical protein
MGVTGGADNDLGMAGFASGATLWPIQANSGPGPSLGGNAWARAIEWVRTAKAVRSTRLLCALLLTRKVGVEGIHEAPKVRIDLSHFIIFGFGA